MSATLVRLSITASPPRERHDTIHFDDGERRSGYAHGDLLKGIVVPAGVRVCRIELDGGQELPVPPASSISITVGDTLFIAVEDKSEQP